MGSNSSSNVMPGDAFCIYCIIFYRIVLYCIVLYCKESAVVHENPVSISLMTSMT